MASSTDHGFFGSWVQIPHPPQSGIFTGHDPTRGAGQGGFKISRVGSGRVITFSNLTGRVGSGRVKRF